MQVVQSKNDLGLDSRFRRNEVEVYYCSPISKKELTVVATSAEARSQIVALVRDFVRREVEPVAAELDAEDRVPHDLIDQMKELGLFGKPCRRNTAGWGWTTRPSPAF